MDKVTNILMVGVGGQGILLSSNILSSAALRDGFDVKKSEIHGMSQRGGSVFSHIRFGSIVYSPVISRRQADIILALEEMEVLRWIDYASEDCKIIFSRERILPAGTTSYPEGVEDEIRRLCPNVYPVCPDELKKKIENVKTLNVALLGILSDFVSISDASWQSAIKEFVPAATLESNLKAFQAGRNIISEK
ncbi:MAG: hypothetical protein A2017_20030 [Lentisphaerae bacterium GWF2_44_16]|nr:MAG: hypothetical protein A2017_20030 [Lentisphaerae bacterium GWF2_44_16]